MKRVCSLLLLLLFFGVSQAQVEYLEIPSPRYNEPRKIKLQLPRSYNSNTEKTYPLIVVLDGNYLFEPVAGNVDYFSYWEDMPEAIVVGIVHDNRQEDTKYSPDTHLPIEEGATFFEFVGLDLYAYISENYRISNFNMVVGHDITANFANYYLLKDNPLFNAYISLSPDLVEEMPEWLTINIGNSESKIFYYQATASGDLGNLKKGIEALDTRLKSLDKPNFKYYFENLEGANHYTLATRAIPRALEHIFSVFKPITREEYQDVILNLEGSAYDYLEEKYKTIEDLFELRETIRVNDFLAISQALEKKSNWEDLLKLGKLAQDEYPGANLGYYYIGLAQEGLGEKKKALKTYESAYPMNEIGGISEDLLQMRASRLKRALGYD